MLLVATQTYLFRTNMNIFIYVYQVIQCDPGGFKPPIIFPKKNESVKKVQLDSNSSSVNGHPVIGILE